MEEEAGLTFEPTTLLCVEYGSGYWYRLTFTGRITGQGLKKIVRCLRNEHLQYKTISYKNKTVSDWLKFI